jgi:CHAD domain-containing protein
MRKGTGKITHELKTRRKALLSEYDDEYLHRFRVTIRRARALLKQHPGDQSRNVRREWRSLAEKTNAARDWDTLAIYIDSTLAPEQRRAILPRMRHYRELARGQVIEALRFDDWDTTWRHWLEWAEDGEKGEAARAPTLDSTDMLQAARTAARNALSLQDERSWHKFRIAIKNLRYSLDSPSAKSSWKKQERKALKRLCKRLQEQLGDWHDTVVHGRLIETMLDDIPANESGNEKDVLRSLLTGIESRRLRCLAASVGLIETEGHVLGLTSEA